MRKIIAGVLGLLIGYAAGAGIGAGAIELFSRNLHDKSLEMVMTAAFVTGPMGGLIGLLAGLLWPRRVAAPTGQGKETP
jgi:hypothetical protein